jgi:hypothetical protein
MMTARNSLMKILLVDDNGQMVAQVNDVEKYAGSLPGHTAGLLDLLEVLIASARSSNAEAEKLARSAASEVRI